MKLLSMRCPSLSLWVLLCGVLLMSPIPVPGQVRNTSPAPMSIESQQALVNRYCAGCHNDRNKSGGFSWTSVDLAHPEQYAQQVERGLRKLRAGLMPPSGAPRPDAATIDAFMAALETGIDQAAATRPHSKAPELHRVNRREYRNSIRDLLDLDVDISAFLPPDARTGSFD